MLIYIPTKGRPHSRIFKELQLEGLDLRLCVEPAEFDIYAEANPGIEIIQLEKDNQGIIRTRNQILDFARARGDKYFAMADDDIIKLIKYEKGRLPFANHKINYRDGISELICFMENEDLTMISPVYRFLVSFDKTSFNRICEVFVIFNLEKLGELRYDETLEGKEDRDFSMQVVSSGRKTCSYGKIGLDFAQNGSNKGGLFDWYKAGKNEKAVDDLVAKWGDAVTKITKKMSYGEIIDAKINWKKLCIK